MLEFIQCKSKEEKKARTLIDSGEYEANFNGEAYSSIMFQNANLSVRVSATSSCRRPFWKTAIGRRTGSPIRTQPGPEYKARELMKEIAEGTWYCGDPGLQYETTINRWHTCKNTGPINASNPCSEYMFLDDTACNLASMNLKKFQREDGTFDVEAVPPRGVPFSSRRRRSSSITPAIPRPTSPKTAICTGRWGLGYANLGSLLMSMGIPYDSDAGRGICGAL